ncbi:MAG: ATP-binding protein [Desulfomonile tiedjei]|nr:ATP-binding protein [Desulfomonile tiedjei]
MEPIPQAQVIKRIQTENMWWNDPYRITDLYYRFRHRAYFDLLLPLVEEISVRRAILLMGPRRVGKTVLIHHIIQRLIDDGIDPKQICYISVDHPIYNGLSLQVLLELFSKASGVTLTDRQLFVFFDEIQYLKDWEIHLKAVVDTNPHIKFTASGSAAAALRLRSRESGAGRFTDFLLPPLTFHEYLDLLGKDDLVDSDDSALSVTAPDIRALNDAFVHYLNFGGYPEVIFSERIQSDPARFVKADIIDKVLLRDLPSLYGIQDIQELNYLFTTLAFNTANEVSLDELSRNSGAAKNTIKRYIEYLEAAFLIKVVHRIDRTAKRFRRANYFKIYLTNPSMRSALFSPIGENDEFVGPLAETGILSQWFHSDESLNYARWRDGEVDIVYLDHRQRLCWAVEVKWSDRFVQNPWELKSVMQFCHSNNLEEVTITSRSVSAIQVVENIRMEFIPASLYCYSVGRNLIKGRGITSVGDECAIE